MVEAFEGNTAETLTMVQTIRSFMDAHRLPDVTVVADAGMISAANQRAIEDRTGWSIRKFVRTARRYRTIRIQAGDHTLTAADPQSDDLRHALKTIHAHPGAH